MDKEHLSKVYEMGVYFGYPKCCINWYIDDKIYGRISSDRNIVGNKTGFVPCNYHIKMIERNEIKIEDLIQSRVTKKPFPFHNENDLYNEND